MSAGKSVSVEVLEERSLLASTLLPGTPDLVQAAAAAYSPPIVITSGGTYSGNWASDDPAVPAVTIRTSSRVIIQNSNIQSRGDLIDTAVPHVNLTVQNTHGYGLNPNVAGQVPGRFLDAESFDNIVIENNDLESTSGVWLLGYSGNGKAGNTIKILGNIAHNIDGRKSDGAGGWMNFNSRTRISDGYEEDGYEPVQFVQLDKVQHVPGIEIAWNQVINDPGNSRVEDNISIYLSSGTAASPILIHNNYINGAYTIEPWQASYSDGTWNYDWGFSGGGIMLGDGKPDTRAEASGYVMAYNNLVVSTTNYAIAISAGHDIQFDSNRMISSDTLPDGRSIFGANSGAYIWNSYGVPASLFFNNSGRNNVVGWEQGNVSKDWWVPDATSWTHNVAMPGPITLSAEAAAVDAGVGARAFKSAPLVHHLRGHSAPSGHHRKRHHPAHPAARHHARHPHRP